MPTSPQLRAEILTVLETYENWLQAFPPDSGPSVYVLGGVDALRIALAVVDGADAKTAISQAREATRIRHYNVTHPTQERDR